MVSEHTTKKFHSISQWNLFGSIFFESIKLINQFFLLNFMSLASYGKLGFIFSITFLLIHVLGFEAESSLPPFINDVTQNQKSFRSFIFKYFSLQLLLLTLASLAYAIFFYNKLEFNLIIIPFFLIIFEGMRILLRAFLHTVFLSKKVVLIESSLTLLFISLIWMPLLINKDTITIPHVLSAYLIISVLAVVIFLKVIKTFCSKLPNEESTNFSKNIFKRIFRVRFFNSLIKTPENFFSENFLIPFFAFKFGYAEAGIFKLASYIARSIKSIIHAVIGFSGGGLFASLKKEALKAKQAAFYLLSKKLNRILFFIFIFLIINYNKLLSHFYTTQTVILATILFLFFAISEHFLIIYEQFYILEEQVEKLFTFKLLEITLFGLILYFGKNFSPIEFFIILLITRTIIFIILAMNAYIKWGLTLSWKISWRFFLMTIGFSMFFYFLTSFTSF